MACASQDSSQWNSAASGAAISRPATSADMSRPSRMAATISALNTPTPMKAATRATPSRMVAARVPRHGRTTDSRVPSVARQPTWPASASSGRRVGPGPPLSSAAAAGAFAAATAPWDGGTASGAPADGFRCAAACSCIRR
ncbi:hypothetical protein D3C86_1461740 [compost metagenome]